MYVNFHCTHINFRLKEQCWKFTVEKVAHMKM